MVRRIRAVPAADAAVPAGVAGDAALAGPFGPADARAVGPRHVAALEQLRGGPVTVSELASRLGLTLPTVSGVLADLDRAGLVDRHADPADRRRTIVRRSSRPRAPWSDSGWTARPAAGPGPGQARPQRAGRLPQGHGPAKSELRTPGTPG